MNDLLDAFKLWAVASVALIMGAVALSYAELLPLPLCVSLWLSGGLAWMFAATYYAAGIASLVVCVRTIRGKRDA